MKNIFLILFTLIATNSYAQQYSAQDECRNLIDLMRSNQFSDYMHKQSGESYKAISQDPTEGVVDKIVHRVNVIMSITMDNAKAIRELQQNAGIIKQNNNDYMPQVIERVIEVPSHPILTNWQREQHRIEMQKHADRAGEGR